MLFAQLHDLLQGNVIAVTESGEMTGKKLEESRSGGEEKAGAKAPDTATASGAIGSAATATGHLKPDKKSAIPEISYSSSDDDDFYDAEDQGRLGGNRSILV